MTEQCPYHPAAKRDDMAFLPYTEAYLADPHRFHEWYRQEQPVFFSPEMHMWVVSRYDDVLTMLKDPAHFSSKNWFSTSARLAPETLEVLKGTMFDSESGGLVSADPPIHTRLRRALTSALTPQLVALLEDDIRSITNRVIDAFPADDPLNVVEHFARRLPVPVLCRLIGIPQNDHEWIRQLCDTVEVLFIQTLPEDEQKEKAQAYMDLFNYIGDLLDRRRADPQTDLATAIQHGGDHEISRAEAIELLITLLTAGIGTSTHFLSACLLHLVGQGVWQTLDSDPKRLAAVVEETLRVVSPVHGVFRITTQEVQLGGATLPAGALVYGVVASANRDEQHFPHGEQIDLEREKGVQHLSFGYGIHYCAGAPVFRLEARIALAALHERFPNLRLDAAEPPIRYLPGLLMRGVEQFSIRRA